jgi:ribosomal protein S18 acetylase RimI-like enzyme
MIDNRGGAASLVSEALKTQAKTLHDAVTLRDAVREAIRTSPDSFLTTLAAVEAKELDYWNGEILSSTWVVAERDDGQVVGVAASKSPKRGIDEESDQDSRYIESVWIAPSLRGHKLGERLIDYLMEVELRKNPRIRQFLLWVFDANSPAISLYKRMDFVQTPHVNEGVRTEIKYRLSVSPEIRPAVCRTVGEAARLNDKQKYGVTYRVLGEGDSA